jgi:hypothetical protein
MRAPHVQFHSRSLAALVACYVWYNPLIQIAAARVLG